MFDTMMPTIENSKKSRYVERIVDSKAVKRLQEEEVEAKARQRAVAKSDAASPYLTATATIDVSSTSSICSMRGVPTRVPIALATMTAAAIAVPAQRYGARVAIQDWAAGATIGFTYPIGGSSSLMICTLILSARCSKSRTTEYLYHRLCSDLEITICVTLFWCANLIKLSAIRPFKGILTTVPPSASTSCKSSSMPASSWVLHLELRLSGSGVAIQAVPSRSANSRV